ncbi:hypothetical protein WJX72_005079 [[Myrmecia] bisecta]|uniref:PPM-type phosphatase domain-containing protein n=1 Tax=[Myrmecia] bisecta TaxID=41462 RepID=A0AAW1R6Z8_9CHLO
MQKHKGETGQATQEAARAGDPASSPESGEIPHAASRKQDAASAQSAKPPASKAAANSAAEKPDKQEALEKDQGSPEREIGQQIRIVHAQPRRPDSPITEHRKASGGAAAADRKAGADAEPKAESRHHSKKPKREEGLRGSATAPSSRKASLDVLGGHDIALSDAASKEREAKAASAAGKARGAEVPRHKLSFGDELDEDKEGQAEQDFSMAASTARRFQTERGIVQRNLVSSTPVPAFKAAIDDDNPVTAQDRMTSLGQLAFGVATARGARPYMEDRHTIIPSFQPTSASGGHISDGVYRSFAGIYDGHNGAKAAEHCCARLHLLLAADPALRDSTGDAKAQLEGLAISKALRSAFHAVDAEILDRARAEAGRDGSTGLVVLRVGEVVYAAHAGDSRAVLGRSAKALRLTEDHKPNLPRERERVELLGGRVNFQRCWRVICEPKDGRPGSGLAVSRSFGDLDFKEPQRFVECEPDVTRTPLKPEDSFVVLGSDGLWDVISDQQAVDIVSTVLQAPLPAGSNSSTAHVNNLRAKSAADALLQAALKGGTMDNVTAMVLLMQWD